MPNKDTYIYTKAYYCTLTQYNVIQWWWLHQYVGTDLSVD